MDGCPHCDKAKEALVPEIQQGKVKLVQSSDAKKYGMDGNGFPQFKSMKTDKVAMGFRNKDKLMKDLGHSDDSKSKNNNGKVKFYHMKGCGFCKKAMEMLEPLINQGKIEVVPHDQAPAGVSGFPHFEGPGGEHTGLPKSVDELMAKVSGSVENYNPLKSNKRRVNAPQFREGFHHIGMFNNPGI